MNKTSHEKSGSNRGRFFCCASFGDILPVSYTHLDVYKRQDKSLGYVADQMAFALGSHCAGQESQLLCRRLALRKLRYLPYLELKYHFENRLMAISYNLELSTEIPTGSQFQEWRCV